MSATVKQVRTSVSALHDAVCTYVIGPEEHRRQYFRDREIETFDALYEELLRSRSMTSRFPGALERCKQVKTDMAVLMELEDRLFAEETRVMPCLPFGPPLEAAIVQVLPGSEADAAVVARLTERIRHRDE